MRGSQDGQWVEVVGRLIAPESMCYSPACQTLRSRNARSRALRPRQAALCAENEKQDPDITSDGHAESHKLFTTTLPFIGAYPVHSN